MKLLKKLGTGACAALMIAAGGLTTETASAARVDIHISGSSLGGWGIWVIFDTNAFSTAGTAPNTGTLDFMVAGTGNPMDIMMPLPDGTVLDGSTLESFMGTAEVLGGLGTETVELALPDIWARFGPLSLHLIFNAKSYALTLESVDPDGTHNYALRSPEPFVWQLEMPGSVQPIELVADLIEFQSPGFIAPPCRADFTGDGTVNIFDILAFLDVWNNGQPGGDFNGDGSFTIFDILEFLAEWNNGCP